jgi:hypothetical protein
MRFGVVLSSLVLSGASFLACGGSVPPAVTAPAASASSAPPAASSASVATAGPARREASDALRQRWPFDDKVQVAAYADLHGLMTTELFGGLVPVLATLARTAGGDDGAKAADCIQALVDAAQEMSFGVDDRGGLVTVRLAPGTGARIDATCDTLKKTRHQKADVTGDVLVMGEPVLVDASKAASAAPWPPGLALDPDRYLAWRVNVDAEHVGHGGLLVSSKRFLLDAEGNIGEDEARAVATATAALPALASIQGLPSDQGDVLRHLMGAVHFHQDGGHLKAAFDLQEPTVEQARDLGAAASLAIYGVRRYLARAKSAEARNTVGQIAKDIAVAYEAETLPPTPRAKKRLASFPPVPKTVPSGVKYASTPADWQAWAPIQFTMDAPQYYQYEVKAAKDGMSAEVVAHGDLDGDGKVSTFRLGLKIDPKTRDLLIEPSIDEQDPTE